MVFTPKQGAQSLESWLTLCGPVNYTLPVPLSVGFSRQEYWSGLPCPPPKVRYPPLNLLGRGELFVNVSNLIKTFDKRSHPFTDTGHSSQRRLLDFLGGASVKEPTCQYRTCLLDPWVRKIPWKRKWQPTSVSLPGESHGQRNLAGYIP